MQLVGCLGPRLEGRAASDPQRSNGFDAARACLGHSLGIAVERGACGCLGVGRVGLAVSTAVLTVRAIDLDNTDTASRKEPRQTRAPSPGPFDTHLVHFAETAEPPQQTAVPGCGRRELGGPQHSADLIDDSGNV